jgi:hypothetical protein
MGELNYFLGFQVKQLKEGTFISQMKYTQDLLKRFGMKDTKPAKTPMGTDGHVATPDFKEQSRVHLIHAPKKTTYIITECIEINVTI